MNNVCRKSAGCAQAPRYWALMAGLLGLFAQFFLANGSLAFAQSNTMQPYLESTAYRLTEPEFADLQSYMPRAKKMLEGALEGETQFSGDALHGYLKNSIRRALELSSFKHELLLFRYVLGRALDLDGTFQAYAPRALGKEVSASLVLRPAIVLALKYYEADDLPRVASISVPSPNWAKFAKDQVPVLLKIADRAPSPRAKLDVVKRALGWTARSLNSSFNRRSYAERIIALTEAMQALDLDPESVGNAEHILLTTQRTIDGAAANLNGERTAQGDVVFPSSAYPTAPIHEQRGDAGGRGSAILPLVSWDAAYTDFTLNGESGLVSGTVELGAGGGFEHTSDGRFSGEAGGDVKASMLATGFPGAHYEDNSPFFGLGAAGAKVRATAAGNASGIAVYNVKASAFVGAAVFGAWIAVEANQYSQFSDYFIRGGWTATLPVRINAKSYVFVRGGWGVAMSYGFSVNPKEEKTSIGQNSSGLSSYRDLNAFRAQVVEGDLILKLGKFMLNIEPSVAWGSAGTSEYVDANNLARHDASITRVAISSALTIPLGLIFPNDAIRIEGSHLSYSSKDLKASFSVQKLGVLYELRW